MPASVKGGWCRVFLGLLRLLHFCEVFYVLVYSRFVGNGDSFKLRVPNHRTPLNSIKIVDLAFSTLQISHTPPLQSPPNPTLTHSTPYTPNSRIFAFFHTSIKLPLLTIYHRNHTLGSHFKVTLKRAQAPTPTLRISSICRVPT